MLALPILTRVIVAVSAIMAAVVARPAGAQTTATHGGVRDRLELTVPVTASISGRCGFSAPPDTILELGNIEAGFSREVRFALQCSTPLRIAVVSQNGGLKAPGTPPRGYSNHLEYTVTLQAVGFGGTSVVASCTAAELTASATAPCSFRGAASTILGLRLPGASSGDQGSYLRISALPTSGRMNLMASASYADVLMLTLSPST